MLNGDTWFYPYETRIIDILKYKNHLWSEDELIEEAGIPPIKKPYVIKNLDPNPAKN